MFRQTAMARPETANRQRAERTRDARVMTSELAETLGVLVVPALLFSAVSLFFG
jgi:hypothetical protein